MIFSKEQMFEENNAPGTGLSTNVLHIGKRNGTVLNAPAPLKRDIGPGKGVCVGVSATSGGAGAFQVDVVVADNAALTTNKKVVASYSHTFGGTGENKIMQINVLPDDVDQAYLGLEYTDAATTTVNAAGIVAAKQTNETVAGA